MPDNSKKKDFIATQLAMTKQFEGTGRGRPFYVYNDTKGIPTIGYGINLNDKGNLQYLKNKGYNVNNLLSGKIPIKPKDAEEFTLNKLNSLYDDFSKNYKGFSNIPEHGQHTLIDLQYNMGPQKLKEFKLMNAAFQRGDMKTAAAELKNSDYYNQTKTRAQAHYNTLLNPPKPTFVLKPIAMPKQEPGYLEEFMTGYNAPFGDTKTDYNFPTRVIEGARELFGLTDYSSQQKPKKQEYGGKLTAEGKKRRKYGPRTYEYNNPTGMTTGPITQRSIGNTPGGGYMSFGDGGWTYPANTAYPMHRKGGYVLLGHEYPTYADGGAVTWSIVEDRPMAQDGLLTGFPGMDTGVQASDNTRTAVPQQAANIVQAKQFQSDLRNPKVSEEKFKTKHGISREEYRNRPTEFAVGMNQVWQGAKEPFKFIGADPDLIRKNPAVGIPQALSGTLMMELPIQEMGTATYNMGKNVLNAGKTLAEEGLVQLGNYGYYAPKNLISDVRRYSKGIKNLQDDLMYFNSNAVNLSSKRYKELENIRRISNQWKSGDVDEATRITKLLNSGLPEEQIANIANARPSELQRRLERLKTPEALNPPVPEGYVSGIYTGPSIEDIRNQYGHLIDNPPPLVEIDPRVFNLERPTRSRRNSRTLISNNDNLSLIERLASRTNSKTRIVSEKSIGDVMSKLDNKNIRLDFRQPRSIKGSFYRHSNKDVTEELNQLQKAINESRKGEAIHGAFSVSDSSYPLFLSKLAQNTKSGKVTPTFSGEYKPLNEAGYLFNAGVPKEDIAGYINKHITNLEETIGKNLPKVEIVDDQIMYPAFGAIKRKLGGWVGYPDHTMYSSGMERFDRVKNYTKYADGGNILPYNISDPEEFKKANKAYQDSAADYRRGEALWNKSMKEGLIEINFYEPNYANLAKDQYKFTDPNVLNRMYSIGGPRTVGVYQNKFSPLIPIYQKPVRKPIYTPEPEYNYIQHSEPLGPQNFKEETITMPNGQKIFRSEFEKQYGSKVTEKQFDKKAKGGKVTWQIID